MFLYKANSKYAGLHWKYTICYESNDSIFYVAVFCLYLLPFLPAKAVMVWMCQDDRGYSESDFYIAVLRYKRLAQIHVFGLDRISWI